MGTFDATTWAWEQQTRHPQDKLVLLAVANHPHLDKDELVEAVQEATGLTEEPVRKALGRLRRDGLLKALYDVFYDVSADQLSLDWLDS